MWDGCRILDEAHTTILVPMDHLLRGALVCPVNIMANECSHYFVDSIDADIFLRANKF